MIYQKGHVPRDITITIIRSLSQYKYEHIQLTLQKQLHGNMVVHLF